MGNLYTAHAAFDTHLNTFASANSLKVQWEGVAFEDAQSIYLRTHYIPTGSEPELTGGDHEKGIYQVSVVYPAATFGKDGVQGIGKPLAVAQALVDHFKRRNLGGVGIFIPQIGPSVREDDDWRSIPVSINFTIL